MFLSALRKVIVVIVYRWYMCIVMVNLLYPLLCCPLLVISLNYIYMYVCMHVYGHIIENTEINKFFFLLRLFCYRLVRHQQPGK